MTRIMTIRFNKFERDKNPNSVSVCTGMWDEITLSDSEIATIDNIITRNLPEPQWIVYGADDSDIEHMLLSYNKPYMHH